MSAMCESTHKMCWKLSRIGIPFDPRLIPLNGIYVLFEKGEDAHGGDRIVRIGTHTGLDNLPSRLQEHFLVENKDRSIFRKNIGRALLNRDSDPFLAQWEVDLTSSKSKATNGCKIDVRKKDETEKRVTKYIRDQFSFVVILSARGKSDRLELEERLIATISLCMICKPSSSWLGLHSPVEKIRRSGMWNVQGLWKETGVSKDDLKKLQSLG